MSRRVPLARFVVGLSLAAVLGLGMTADTAKAVAPTGGSAPAAASQAAAALETAAKNNKYLFIFFFNGQDAQHQRHEGRLSRRRWRR